MTVDTKFLIRISQFLEERGVPSEPVLSAIIAARAPNVYLAISTRSQRIDIQLPYTAEALAAVAPTVIAPTIPPRSMLRVITEGDGLSAALVVAGTIPTRTAVDELVSKSAANAWHEILEALPAGGQLNNRTLYLNEPRAAIAIMYPDRNPTEEATFANGIDTIAARLGLNEAQRAAFAKLHPMFGAGAGVSVSTECSAAGPAAHLRFLYGSPSWDLAIELTRAIVDVVATRRVASALGKIAGELSANELRGIELVFDGADVPDVVCWVLPPS